MPRPGKKVSIIMTGTIFRYSYYKKWERQTSGFRTPREIPAPEVTVSGSL